MAIFQKSVLNKYLKSLDDKKVSAAWEAFKAYFHNSDIQQNIREAKEEQFQEGFLRELFVNILNYTIQPTPGYNLQTELKNVKDSKKADGAIFTRTFKGSGPLGEEKDIIKVLAVIELKGTDTVDLGKVEAQAFGYKSNQPGCRYVITSNFEKLRFYIDDTTTFEEFNLFELREADFKLLWLCLHVDCLLQDLPYKLKTESLVAEQDITKKFYKDYSTFKRELFQDLQKRNPQYDALHLFKKSQKLLDRLLFIFFGEDKGLLPPNLISKLIEEWQRLKDMDEYRPLYDQFKKYFNYIDQGSKRGDLDIFAYNGGLFEADEVLDNLKVDDLVLYRHTFTLSHYDFDSAVDVNILGHIFEHSLNEIEEITAQLEGKDFDQSKTKRKKDGVFYTPRYITKYIVENTIGRLCDEKKTELELHTIDFDKDYRRKDKKMSAEGKAIFNKLTEYRNFLLDLKIVDPACGSGAFLNEALDFLIKQHQQISEQEKRLFDDAFPLDIEKSILENNLYGVDINEEAVEIARLSLWLRTARPGRKLANLSHRIKVGNSLISDSAVAGDKAFDWEKEFPEVFRQKELEAFHVVLTTHNSRTSQRMIKYNVQKGEPVWLEPKNEVLVTQFIREVIVEDQIKCLAYNICGDHVHLILVCEVEELSKIVQKIKSVSSRKYNIAIGKTIPRSTDTPSGHDNPSGHDHLEINHLWSQKFFRAQMDTWELASLSTRPGYVYKDTHLNNAIAYIQTNREKHQLPRIPELEALIAEMTCSLDDAFAPQYKGGFDVVIGNPPYVRQEVFTNDKPWLEKHYKVYHGTADLFVYFFEKGIQLLKPAGLYSIIVANKWMRANYGKPLRQFLQQKTLLEIIDFGDLPVFADATAYPCIITIAPKKSALEYTFFATEPKTLDFSDLGQFVKEQRFPIVQKTLDENGWTLVGNRTVLLLEKIKNVGVPLEKYVNGEIFYGIKTGLNEAFVIDEATKNRLIQEDAKSADIIKPFLAGRDVKRYAIDFQNSYLIFTRRGIDIEKYPAIKKYLKQFKPQLEPKPKDWEGGWSGRKPGPYEWYEIQDAVNYYEEFEKPKMILPDISLRGNFALDEKGEYYLVNTAYIISSYDKALLGILNSKLITFFYQNLSSSVRGGYLRFIYQYLIQLPIPKFEGNDALYSLVEKIIDAKKQLSNTVSKFLRTIQRHITPSGHDHLEEIKISRKLEAWHELTFAAFVQELKKHKVTLSLKDEMEWESVFEEQRTAAQALKDEIDKTDREIDQLVYTLYGLTEEEIGIVEGV